MKVFLLFECAGYSPEDYYESVVATSLSEDTINACKVLSETDLENINALNVELRNALNGWGLENPRGILGTHWENWSEARRIFQAEWLTSRSLTVEMLSIDEETTYEIREHELL